MVAFAERRTQSFHGLRHRLAHLRSVHVLSIAHVLVVIEGKGIVLLLLLETLRLCLSVGLAVVSLMYRRCFLAVVHLVLNRMHVVFIVLHLLVIFDRHALLTVYMLHALHDHVRRAILPNHMTILGVDKVARSMSTLHIFHFRVVVWVEDLVTVLVNSVATRAMCLLMLHKRPSIVEDFLAVTALHGNLLIRMLLPQVNIQI